MSKNDSASPDKSSILQNYMESPTPEQPEPVALFIQMENWHIPFFAGGLADQPHIFIEEMQTCVNAKNKAIEIREKQNTPAPPPK